ncbi:uncharacterized protein [Primulina eburnea]|uniref:uncharacterized protein isoform X1 n=1 Tax=Primulina eburnea TaxID=1245227 RepID=UPI003C6C3CA7
MSCINIAACQLVCSRPAFLGLDFQFNESSRNTSSYLGIKLPKISLKRTSATTRYQQAAPVCLFGGKGKSENADEQQASQRKAFENTMGNFRKDQSIEDVLKQQIQKQEYYDDGGGKPPRGGGGSGDASGEDDEEGLSGIWDESVQVILATLGFIFLYIYIIEAEEATVLAKDLIKFLFTRQKSLRLVRIISEWEDFFAKLNEKEVVDPYWLEREIINTTTMYDSPEKYRRILYKAYLDSKADDDEGDDNFR